MPAVSMVVIENDTLGIDITLSGRVLSYSSIIKPADIVISNEAFALISTIVDLWLCLTVSSVGVLTNVLDIVTFAKMGFKDTVNITMTTIAFWDLIRVLCGLAHRLYGPISWVFPAFGKSWQNITVTNIVYLHVISGNVSYVIGGYVAIERCFCVCFPLKVKTLLTPKLTSFICVTLSVLVFVSLLPILLVFEYRWVYTAQYQTVIAVYQYTHFYNVHGQKFMEGYKYLGFIYPVLSLAAMVFSTVVISYNLQRASRFRKGASARSKPDRGQSEVTTRDRQVVTMLLVVIGVYIVNLVPRVVHFVAMLLEPEYYVLKYYNNIFWVIVYVIFVLDFVNASVNLFIFYFMSTRFRACFIKLFQPKCLSGKT